MAQRGQKPKSIELKKLAGNPGKRPLPDSVLDPERPSGRAPHGLSAGALKFWRKHAWPLIQLGVLRVTDIPAFILMAELYAVGVKAARDLEAAGSLTTAGSMGQDVARPEVGILKTYATAFRLYAAEFGMTPSSRGRMVVGGEEEEPSLAEQLFGLVRGSID